jgi:putative transposase
MRYQLDSSPHSVYSLNYHLIFCVKYCTIAKAIRRKVLTDEISIRLKDVVIDISKDFQVKIIEQETDKDHIHILFKTKPTINMTKYINSMKGISSNVLFQEFPEIKMRLWNGHLWSRSYCLLTTGQTTLDILKKYVESQGENKTQKVENKCHMCGWE